MTFEELIRRNGLCGRVLSTHEKSGYAFRGTITRTWIEGILVHIMLANRSRKFEAERGPWKNLPGAVPTMFAKNIPVEVGEDGIVSFDLPLDGGRAYINPKRRKTKEAADGT